MSNGIYTKYDPVEADLRRYYAQLDKEEALEDEYEQYFEDGGELDFDEWLEQIQKERR